MASLHFAGGTLEQQAAWEGILAAFIEKTRGYEPLTAQDMAVFAQMAQNANATGYGVIQNVESWNQHNALIAKAINDKDLSTLENLINGFCSYGKPDVCQTLRIRLNSLIAERTGQTTQTGISTVTVKPGTTTQSSTPVQTPTVKKSLDIKWVLAIAAVGAVALGYIGGKKR